MIKSIFGVSMTETEQALVNERIFETISELSKDIKALVSSNHELANAQGVLSTEVKHLCKQLSNIEKDNKEAIAKFEKSLSDQSKKFQTEIDELREIQREGCPAIEQLKTEKKGTVKEFQLIADGFDQRLKKLEDHESKVIWLIVLSVLGGLLGLLGLKGIK